ncbi:VacJ family lipoprotein [Aristophania vespae]|uniref:VacJ family lipoprotein n=1 Tax=Aristophania vespae TaxID=2697033 RepID=A0A6P1NJT5_9PROT|nr:VacJ family lipoprotein [Aristophania vespae]QHI95942.1 VacJ family lipoprotein [Aristophania vespae]UMM63683.1 Intermembrane phospholipid transport system lipoprotein MlaA [Aristophania vespae]
MACRTSKDQLHKRERKFLRVLAGACALLTLSACGSLRNPPPKDPEALQDYKQANDPYEPVNRKMFGFNSWAYHNALRPVGRAWKNYIPSPVRNSVATLNETWRQPAVFFSDVGAGKPRRAGDSFMRYLINMTAGVAGFFDVASLAGYKQHETDPGMVMGLWGLETGPYIFLPFLGPSNFRDMAGYAISQGLTPINYVPRGYGLLSFNWGYNILGAFNTFADSTDQLDQLERESLDPYAFLRSAWQQNRQGQIDALKADHRATTPDWY